MTSVYVYNPACMCAWCSRGGTVPENTPDNRASGGSFGYDQPHIPPPATSPDRNGMPGNRP